MTPKRPIEKITFVGPAYPYRGGLATIIETLARTFSRRGVDASIETFSLQYPRLLFPGKSQLREGAAPDDLQICRSLNSINPLSWWRLGRRLRRESPDVVLMKYWTPFLAPALGSVARSARRNGHTKVIVQLDNITPHEPHRYDRPLNSFFLRSCDGFIYMSEAVRKDLESYVVAPALFSPHPLFESYGRPLSKQQACRNLGIDSGVDWVLFFGYIRDYKGLDILLDAWALLKTQGRTKGRKLLVAGETYGDGSKYARQIENLGLNDDIVFHNRFIADSEVAAYFSAASLVALPYRSATQSGITQVAYYYGVPMVVTRVGGLAEIVRDDVVGLLCDPTPESVANAVERALEPQNGERYRLNMPAERERFSWDATADTIEKLYRELSEK